MLRKGRDKVHPYVPEIAEKLGKGEVSRREFLGTVARLGVFGRGRVRHVWQHHRRALRTSRAGGDA